MKLAIFISLIFKNREKSLSEYQTPENNAIIQNQAQWGYGPTQVYGIPNTTGNAGQYQFP
jgi:hypothetical protein